MAKKKLVIPKNYYSVRVEGEDCNSPSEVMIERHDNAPNMDTKTLKGLFNHFASKKEALAARKLVVKALK